MSGIKDKAVAFGKFIYNGDERTVLGRGGRSWAEIGFFYLIFYSCLAGFFAGMLAVFYQTIDENSPKLMGDSSLLKGNPGMGFKPMPDIESTLVRFGRDSKSFKGHVESIQSVLDKYENVTGGVNCNEAGRANDSREACRIDFEGLTTACNKANQYGYASDVSQPCILLRLNKIFGWEPELYTAENVADTDMTDNLKEKIKENPNMIWIECVGENPADLDNVGVENITYYPTQGFPSYYYPYLKQKNYLPPLVFVKFNSLRQNVAVMVECRAWARNINYDRTEKEGGVHFELLFDP